MASDKANIRQRRKSEKSTGTTAQEMAKNGTPADGENAKKQ